MQGQGYRIENGLFEHLNGKMISSQINDTLIINEPLMSGRGLTGHIFYASISKKNTIADLEFPTERAPTLYNFTKLSERPDEIIKKKWWGRQNDSRSTNLERKSTAETWFSLQTFGSNHSDTNVCRSKDTIGAAFGHLHVLWQKEKRFAHNYT